jgi:hypothetical protein
MRNVKVWLLSSTLVATLSTAVFIATPPSLAQNPARQERRAERSYWRHHDGRWNYWDASDKRWYYTDGSNWFYHANNRWQPYRFDASFGREGFTMGQYAPPAAGTNIAVPTHGVYVP